MWLLWKKIICHVCRESSSRELGSPWMRKNWVMLLQFQKLAEKMIHPQKSEKKLNCHGECILTLIGDCKKGRWGKVELNCLSSWENFTWFCAGNPCISVFIKAVEKAWNNETKKFVDSIRLFRSWYCRDCKRTSLYWLLDGTMRFHQVKCGHEPGDILW